MKLTKAEQTEKAKENVLHMLGLMEDDPNYYAGYSEDNKEGYDAYRKQINRAKKLFMRST